MKLNKLINNFKLERLIYTNSKNIGKIYIKNIIEFLRNLGFFYASCAGINSDLREIKTSSVRTSLEQINNYNLKKIELVWQSGQISNVEKIANIRINWNLITTIFQKNLKYFFKRYNCLNKAYILIKAGARGNWNQLQQLAVFRGLMLDSVGKPINIFINASVTSGLNLLQYLISSFGARKGIIDTTLRTANCGFLTRQLIYFLQDVLIKDILCNTKNYIKIIKKKYFYIMILGKTIINISFFRNNFILKKINLKNIIITNHLISKLKSKSNQITQILLKSILTCNLFSSICQSCYGWDLAKRLIISLGNAIGILTAQTIGEPGTQMTLRTFHIGGIFIGEANSLIFLKQSIKLKPIFFKFFFNTHLYNLFLGINLYLSFTKKFLNFTTWKNLKKKIILKPNLFFHKTKQNLYLKKNILFEKLSIYLKFIYKERINFLPIYSERWGSITILNKFKYNLFNLNITETDQNYYLTNFSFLFMDTLLYQLTPNFLINLVNIKYTSLKKNLKISKFYSILNLSKLYFHDTKNFFKSFINFKIVSPYFGNLKLIKKNILILLNTFYKKYLNLKNYIYLFNNCICVFSYHFLNFQYIDTQTLFAHIYFYSKF